MKPLSEPVILILLFVFYLQACSEIYDPQVQNASEILVVEALLTDVIESYHVKLSYSIPYNSSVTKNPVTGALVYVRDHSDDRIISFLETSDGYYEFTPDSGEQGIAGHTYTLYIETTQGDHFESLPESLNRTSIIDSVYGKREDRTTLTISDNGSTQYKTQTYLNVIADLQGTGVVPPRMRFKADWLYEMIDPHEGCMFNCPPPWYIWRFSKDGPQSLTEPTQNRILKEQLAGTALIDYFQTLYDEEHLVYLVLIMNGYHLNEDSYSFYQDMKDQLSAENALFDPITTQITGNIKCINDPDKIATGLFEVSMHETGVYMIIPKQLSVKKVKNFNGLPSETDGFIEGTAPDWWIVR
jgi:hypothetical protein